MAESMKAATMEEFRQTPYYQGLGIEALEQELQGYQSDDEALRRQAEAQYRPAYESEREAAQQALEKEIQGYSAQLAETGAEYDRQRRKTNQAYEESAVDLNNALTKRGLGRSSLVSAQGAYLQDQRNQALSDIDREESGAINAINEKIALLTGQAAESERTRAGNYARQLENRVNELREKNKNASISLQLQIAALQQQGYEAYQDWLLKNRQQEIKEKEFAAEYGDVVNVNGGSSSSSSAGGSGAKKETAQKEQNRGKISGAAGAAVGSIADFTKKLIAGLTSGVKAASAAQKKAGGTVSLAKTAARAGTKSIRQNAKE